MAYWAATLEYGWAQLNIEGGHQRERLEDLLKEKLDDNIIAAMEEHVGFMHGGELWRLWLRVHQVEWEVWRLCV